MEEEKLIVCECHNIEHQIIIQYDKEFNEAYLSVHLNRLCLFDRIKHAIKYIFGHKSIYGDFDEVIINDKYADFFIELGRTLNENK